MSEILAREFVDFSASKLEQLAGRIGECLGKLDCDQVWARGSENENAVGNLVLHLCGNLRQWIGAGVAGKADIRVRDREFRARGDIQPEELRERLAGVVTEAVGVIRGLSAEQLAEKVTVQGYEVTKLEAVYHAVEHFAQHAGQIMFATKMATAEDLGFYRHLAKGAGHGETTP
ncbi:MAG: DinB family protein [bacterium]|nr:DinB family protein [bacterium]